MKLIYIQIWWYGAPQPNNHRKERRPNTSPHSRAPFAASSPPNNNSVMGQVKILKCGEQLMKPVPPINKAKPKDVVTDRKDVDLGLTDRIPRW
ncbi:hypothetical protein Tsubulata_010480 [Turnera subulata]|uniref:Uncharacterized protein n=1 Tax=Turnera subulata TaxID=218843 RepID=A0A9Q0F3C0_9ROSI|nr:hypothetical protein Tsubulata_010480 [Turnera subulata]